MRNRKKSQRRLLLKAGVASMFAPRIVFADTPTNPDVVIIGAGIAGIEAAKTLHSQGISYVVVEANNRIGGRVYTNNDIFGVPFDTHAHWMSYPSGNPLIKYGKINGFNVYRDPRVSKSFVGNREATEEEYRDLDKTYDLFDKRIEASSNHVTGDDDNARSALGEDFFKRPWGYTVASNWGVWRMAQNSKDYSPKDWWNSVGGGQHFCREGYATTTGKIPFWDGSYSTAKPGKQPMRAVLRQTLAEKLFFSGEACHATQWATVNGGLNAGKISAKQAARYIKNYN